MSDNFIQHKITGRIIDVKPTILPNLGLLVYAYKNCAHVYDIGNRVMNFSFDKHDDKITCLFHIPDSRTQIISISNDGQLFLWDVMDGSIKMEALLVQFIHNVLQFDKKDQILYFIHRKEKRVNLSTYSFKDKSVRNFVDGAWSSYSGKSVIGGTRENSFAAVICHRGLIIWSLVTDYQSTFKMSKIVCLAAHPTDSVLAVSFANKKIEVWWNALSTKFENIKKIILRWHVHPAYCLTFSNSGCNLLSGSHEGVLVRWDLSQGSSVDNKQFMARLGAPLKEIVCSEDDINYVISLTNNSFLIANASTLRIEHSYKGLILNPYTSEIKLSDIFPCGLSLDPNSNNLLINGLPGYLQYYDPINLVNKGSLDVTRQNYVSPVGEDKPVYSDIYRVHISDSGKWLLTYCHMNSNYEAADREAQIIFWIHNSKKKIFEQLHNFELAQSAPVTSMAFRSKLNTSEPDPYEESELVIGQEDGCVMLWRRVKYEDTHSVKQNNNVAKSGVYWTLSRHWFLHNIPNTTDNQSRDARPLLLEFSPVHDAMPTRNQCLMLARDKVLFAFSWSNMNKGVFLPLCKTTISKEYQIDRMRFSRQLPVNSAGVLCAFRLITSEFNSSSNSSSMTIWELKLMKLNDGTSWSVIPITSCPLRVTALAVHPKTDMAAVCHTPFSTSESTQEQSSHIFIFHTNGDYPILPVSSFPSPESQSSLLWLREDSLLGLCISSSPELYLFETKELHLQRQNQLKKEKEEKLDVDESSKLPLALQLATSKEKRDVSKNVIPGLDVEIKLADYSRELDQKWEQLSRYPAYTAPTSHVLFKEILTFDLKSYLKSCDTSEKQESTHLSPKTDSLIQPDVPADTVNSTVLNYQTFDDAFSYYNADFEGMVLRANNDNNDVINSILRKIPYSLKKSYSKKSKCPRAKGSKYPESDLSNVDNQEDIMVPDSQASVHDPVESTLLTDDVTAVPCSQDQDE